ncbi:MAG: asparagine synthase (glutamine-hydrolyzing) [Myxococcota bacterium]
MCGIVGIFRRGIRPLPGRSALRRMMSSIDHRGPDGGGEFSGDWIQLGAVRLAVVDVKSGDQPVGGCRANISAVYNGELYNHYALRQRLNGGRHAMPSACDSALIPHLYEEFGSSFVEMMRGMFAIALWDDAQRKLILARDRLGIKPLYFAETADYIVFGSEIKAIIASGLIEPEIDFDSLDDLFSLSYPCPPRTMFRGIRELRPAHVLEVRASSEKVVTRRYWQCPFVPAGEHRRFSSREAAEELLSLLKVRVYDHLASDVPVGTYLSGGIDSSTISALCKEVTGDAPTTFSVSFDDKRFDERDDAALVSRFLGSANYSIRYDSAVGNELDRMIWHTELPLQFPLAIPLIGLSGLARSRGFPVVLTGEGADESFGGYDCFRADKMRRVFDRPGLRSIRGGIYKNLYKWHDMPTGTVRRMLDNHGSVAEVSAAFGGIYPPWYDMWTTVGVHRERLLGGNSRRVRPVWEPPRGFQDLLPDDMNRLDPHDAGIAVELATRLPAWILLIGDRASMANGVEARVPFLDHEVVEFVASLSPSMKLNGFKEKAILRSAVKGILPKTTVEKRKRPFFTPIREWFFSPEASEIFDSDLSKDSLVKAGLFDPDLVAAFLSELRVTPDRMLLKNQLEWTLMLVLGAQILHRQFVQERCGVGPRS